ncbi:MAG TPA: hypothetical protein VFB78_09945 [Acidimicrobiales bacterium]|nr:hypothetical protein [Acidimicrobiales bacterium]
MTPIDMPRELRTLLDRTADTKSSALERLFAASALHNGLDELLAELAQAARLEEGYSWADVGKVLDITKQAAQQRLGKSGVIRVDPKGNVSVLQGRARYEAGLRDALDRLDGGLAANEQAVIVEVEVQVPAETAKAAKPTKKVVKAKKAGKKR